MALRVRIGIVDLKDPRGGTLGACRPEVWRAAAALRDGIAPDVPLSAALGEARPSRAAGQLAGTAAGTAAARAAIAAALGIDFVKVGLAGIAGAEEVSTALEAVVAAARAARHGGRIAASGTRVIAASYADAACVGALPPRDLPAAAARAGAAGCLLDTAIKDGRSLTDHLGLEEVARFVADCRGRGLIAALAGSLAVTHLPTLVALRPDVLGARGALCREGREGRLDRGRLILFHDALRVARRAIPAVAFPGVPGPAIHTVPDAPRSWPPDGR